MTLSINSQVSVRLTLHGWARLEDFYGGNTRRALTVAHGGVLKTTVWELMEIFGPHMHHGMTDMPFEENAIEVIAP